MPALPLSEHEHQALDLLEDLPGDIDEAAAAEHGEDPQRVREAIEQVEALLLRIAGPRARLLIRAAQPLVEREPTPTDDDLAHTEALLQAEPLLALRLRPVAELLALLLDLEPDTRASTLLRSLRERAELEARSQPRLDRVAEWIERRFEEAWPEDNLAGAAVPTPLRVFRLAAVAEAPVEVRARALAADAPDDLDLALELLALDPAADAATSIERFDAARGERAAARDQAQAKTEAPPEQRTDGPKRRFTALHLLLALIVLGLTLWHYLLR